MLTYFPVGPDEDQCYLVAYMLPGTKVASIACDKMSEQTAIAEAGRLNAGQVARAKAVQLDREMCGMRRIVRDLQEVI